MDNSTNPILKAQCRALLSEYEGIIKDIIDEQEQELKTMDIDAETEFEFIKKSFLNKGLLEGMKRLLAIINKKAQ